MTWSVLVFFAGPTPLALLVGGIAAVNAPTDGFHICDAMGWPRDPQSVEPRTLTLCHAQHCADLVVDGPVAVITLLPTHLRPPPFGLDAGIVACVVSDDAPPVMILDINFLLAHVQLTSAAPARDVAS